MSYFQGGHPRTKQIFKSTSHTKYIYILSPTKPISILPCFHPTVQLLPTTETQQNGFTLELEPSYERCFPKRSKDDDAQRIFWETNRFEQVYYELHGSFDNKQRNLSNEKKIRFMLSLLNDGEAGAWKEQFIQEATNETVTSGDRTEN